MGPADGPNTKTTTTSVFALVLRGAAIRYRPVCCQIWRDDKFPFASDDCKLVWFHLFTDPESTPLGLQCASIEGLASSLRWVFQRYAKGFREGLAKGFFEYDEKALLIYFPKFFREDRTPNHPDNPNVLIAWGKLFKEMPESQLKWKCYQDIKGLAKGLGKGFQEGFAKGFGEPLSKGLPKGLGTQEQEQEQEQEQDLREEKHTVAIENRDAALPGLEQAKEILEFLNEKTGHSFRLREASGHQTVNAKLILARLKSGATVAQC